MAEKGPQNPLQVALEIAQEQLETLKQEFRKNPTDAKQAEIREKLNQIQHIKDQMGKKK